VRGHPLNPDYAQSGLIKCDLQQFIVQGAYEIDADKIDA
jgi:hypothetical protein